jgi:glycosyltransferase involved in cell wall biosynthesis
MGYSVGRSDLTVSVIVPTRNEERNIEWVLERVPECVDEIIVVDTSDDGTAAAARRARADVRVLTTDRSGKGVALRKGFAAATGDVVVMIDADGSMNPREIPMFLGAIYCGFDFVKGSRHMAGGGSADFTRIRSLGNRVLVRLVNLMYRSALSDLCYGYIAIRRACIPALALEADGFEIETEMVTGAIQAGLGMAEVPSWELLRRSGASNLKPVRDGLRVLRTLFRRRLHRPPEVEGRPPAEVTPLVIDLVAEELNDDDEFVPEETARVTRGTYS